MKSSGNHVDPEKVEQLKSAKIDVENKVKMIIKLAKGINGNKDANVKNKSEIIHLIEDFQQHYESLYSLYEDLRGEITNNANGEADDSSSDSESYYSPVESTPNRSRENGTEISKGNRDSESSSDVEDTILKDKLTSSSEVKETPAIELDTDSEKRHHRSRTRMADLEGEVARLKVTVDCKSDEVTQMREENSRLEARVLELESSCKDREILQREVEALNDEKGKLEEMLSYESNERSGLREQLDSLQQEMKSMSSQKSELELELKKKSAEISNCHVQIENHRNNTANRASIERDAIEENGLEIQENSYEPEKQMINQSELQRKISQLQASLSDKEKEFAAARKRYKANENEFSSKLASSKEKIRDLENRIESLQNERSGLQTELEALRNENEQFSISKSKWERKNAELTDKIADQQKTLLELGETITKLKYENEKPQMKFPDSKPNFQTLERKIEEMAEEFRKQFEDKYRILSRRIRVAEQLQIENKEWYRRTKEANEAECIRNIKEISPVANDILLSLDLIILKFEDCNANFSNRISKAFCELKFAKDWVMRKNNALLHMKHDLDELLCQLDDKEAEILVFREKIWKSENKSRELEKMMKKTEDAMLGLQEEKREAIRQLCVWIDYHRSRSDYYMKMLSEMNPGRRKAS